MAPGIYKSFRKAWDKNREKFQYFIFACNLKNDSLDDTNASSNKAVLKLGENLTNEYIEESLAEYYSNKSKDDKTEDMLVKMTIKDVERECYQAMEAFIHNLNTMHSRGGGQVNCCLV